MPRISCMFFFYTMRFWRYVSVPSLLANGIYCVASKQSRDANRKFNGASWSNLFHFVIRHGNNQKHKAISAYIRRSMLRFLALLYAIHKLLRFWQTRSVNGDLSWHHLGSLVYYIVYYPWIIAATFFNCPISHQPKGIIQTWPFPCSFEPSNEKWQKKSNFCCYNILKAIGCSAWAGGRNHALLTFS